MDSLEFGSATETPEELAGRLKLPFRDALLLSRALTHRSYLNEHPEALEDNERLEFLGDAVLDFLVGAWLYNRFPEMLEGDLTRMRSALVHTERLADYARKIDLGKAMRLGKGETLSGGHRRLPLLCDTFEAVVGALYLDSGIDSVLKFMTPLLDEASDEILAKNQLDDPKSALQEWAQAQGISTPEYVIKSSSGPEHSKVFEVNVLIDGVIAGSGTGRSKQTAAKEAAQQAIKQLGIES